MNVCLKICLVNICLYAKYKIYSKPNKSWKALRYKTRKKYKIAANYLCI